MTTSELNKIMESGNMCGIYLFYGENDFLIDSTLKKIKKTFTELISGINYISIDEKGVNSLIADIATPAFGYDRKLIVVKNANLFKKEAKSKSNDTLIKIKEYLEENIDEINNSTLLIFYENEVEKNELYKTIDKIGNVCNFENLKNFELVKKLKSICNSYEVNIDDNTIKRFIEIVGTDMQENINEIRKLIEYAGKGGTITLEAIDLLTIKKIDVRIFDLTDVLGTRNIGKSMEILKDLIYNKEPVPKILIQLYNHFKKLYIVKLAIKYGEDIAKALNLKATQAWALGKYKTQANLFEEKQLRMLLKELSSLDANYKVGKIDLDIGLEAILCNYCSK